MKKIILTAVSLAFLGSFQNCSSSQSDVVPVVPPNTQLNSLFDAVYLASQGFQDRAKIQQVANDKEVLVISDLKGDKELTFTTGRSNASFVPSPLWPTAPKYYTDDAGGYILVPNVSETYWTSKSFAEIPQPYDAYVVLRDFQAVANEGYFAVGLGLRNRNDRLELSMNALKRTTAINMNAPTVFEFNKRSIVRIRIDGANSALWINNVQVTPKAVNVGTDALSVLGYGTNSHAAQHDFYGMWVKFGTLNSNEHQFIYDELVKQYKPATFPDKPFADKVKINGNAAASPREWSVTYDFVAPAGASEDKTKTQYQWGYVSTSVDLNMANYFSGPNGNKPTLKRADFPAEFPSPGGNKTYIFVVVKAFDTNGNSWDHVVRSILIPDNY